VPEETDDRTTENWIARAIERAAGKLVGTAEVVEDRRRAADTVSGQVEEASALRAALNDELGFYPSRLDEESIAEYRRANAIDEERHARWVRKHGSPRSSHWNQFRHFTKGREPRL